MSFRFIRPVLPTDRPWSADRACTLFLRWYLALMLVIAAPAIARWLADSTTTSSPTAAAGSSSTGCPASTPGSSR